MKHSILTYSLLVALMTAPLLEIQAQWSKSAKADQDELQKKLLSAFVVLTTAPEIEKQTKKAEAAKKAKAEAEAKRLAAAKQKAEAEAKRKEQMMVNEQNRVLGKFFDELYKKRISYAARITEVKKVMADPVNAHPLLQLRLNEQIIRYCQQPPWTRINEYDYKTANTEVPPAAMKIINNESYTPAQKKFAYNALALHYCDLQKFDDAEKLLKNGLEQKDITPNDTAEYLCCLANVYRLNDEYGKAMKNCREAMKYGASVKGANAGATIAISYNKVKDAMEILDDCKNPYNKLSFMAQVYQKDYLRDYVRDEAVAFVKNPENKLSERLDIAARYLFDEYRSAEHAAARKLMVGVPAQLKTNGWWYKKVIVAPFDKGDYALIVELSEIFAGSPIMADPVCRDNYIVSLAAIGKKADAAKLAAEYANDEKCAPADKLRFQFYEAILMGKSTDALLKNSTLPRKEQSEAVRSAAKQCQVWGMSELSEKYAADYAKFFMEQPNRVLKVNYFDTPVKSISDWRKIYSRLDKQMCDVPFKGSMDFLETDVATGNRSVNFEKDSKSNDRMEVTSVCDKFGLHIFLRVQTNKARSIEHGFANGIGTEMYFAPGFNQPYVCMGSEPRKGVTFMFQTTYNNKNYTRPDQKNPKTSFYDEVEFTDTDYVLHMFFAWDDYYNKLPVNGSDYRFECLAWCPDGGFSWGGSQGIHAASAWGSLRFVLDYRQLNAIRRELIFKTYKTYKMEHKDPSTSENIFDVWKDSEIGDPEFYEAKLATLQKELDDYAKLVREDMTDEEVAKVYANAMPRWKGLKHEIDQLRRAYLLEKMSSPEK